MVQTQSSQSSGALKYEFRQRPSKIKAEDSPIEEQSSKDRAAEKRPRLKSPSKKRAAPQSLAETSERPRKKKLAKAKAQTKKTQTKSFQFRSNLRPFFQLIKETKFSTGQLEALQKTPFWLLFNAFISKKVNFSKIRKDDWFICGLIETYSREKKKFTLGDSLVPLTDRDISLIFGIQSGCLPMASKLSSLAKPSTPFVERNFNSDISLSRPLLEACFRKVVEGKTQTHYEDVARVLCLHLCCTVFFPNKGNAIRWGFVRCIEDLETIKDYAWPGLIRKALISSIKSAEVPKKVNGCVLLLPYWLCEHSSLVEAEGDQIPRFLKWDLPLLNRKNAETETNKTKIQVSTSQLVLTEEERKIFPALELERHEGTQEGLEDEFAEEEEGDTEEEEEEEEEDEEEEEEEEETQERDPATSDIMGLSQMESSQNQTMPSSPTIGQGLDTQERDPLTPDVMGLSQMESRQNPTVSTATNFRALDENRILKEEIKKLQEEREKLSIRIKECEELGKDNRNLKLEVKKRELEMEKLSIRIKECEELGKDNQNLKLEIKKLQVEKESETAKLLEHIKECEELEKVNRILKNRIKELEDEKDSEKIQLADEVDNLTVHNLTQGIAYNTEITGAKEKVGALISENNQLFDEYCEVAAQNVTQQATNEEFLEDLLQDGTVQQSALLTQKIKSMYARIKKRGRKVYMKEDYCYETIQRQLENKLEEESKQCLKTGAAKGKGIVEVVNTVDDLPVPKKQVLKVPNKSAVLKLLAETDRTKLRAAIEKEDASTCLWYREGLDVTMHHAVEMLNEGDTSDNIIESFSDIKMRDQLLKEKDPDHEKAHIFEFNSWSVIVGKNENLRKQVLDDPLEKLQMKDYRYMVFPINSVGNSNRKVPYHWTVLVCDNVNQKWIHYNSLKPRGKNRVDPYLKDAMIVKKYVEHIRKTVDKKEREQGTSDPHFELLTPQYDWEIVSAEKSPQQAANSVDCGILTCLVMDCIINNEDIPSKVSKEHVRSFRAYILERLLNDGPNSYQLKTEE